jgi:methylated-DNA-[protein]-cysteine S-methyltransferase
MENRSRETKLFRGFADTPVGRLRLLAADEGLAGVYFPDHRRARNPEAQDVEHHPVLDLARRELAEYFAGVRTAFRTPLAPASIRGGTPFQLAVWDALVAIPFGETRSYGEIARGVGRPDAARAVGAANALNPIAIFVPCHRVVGGSGTLTGYAGGIETKRWLLALEAPQLSVLGAPQNSTTAGAADGSSSSPMFAVSP